MSRGRAPIVLVVLMVALASFPPALTEWVDLEPFPSATLEYPPGGGTCTTYLRLLADGTVKATDLDLTGGPLGSQASNDSSAHELWTSAAGWDNLTWDGTGFGLDRFGGWWEEDLNAAGNLTRTSPDILISVGSRVMVLGVFPGGSNYSVEILEPELGYKVMQSGLRNGDELDPALWAGMGSSYRRLVLRLTVTGASPDATPEVVKWGAGTGWRAGEDSSLTDITWDANGASLASDSNSTNYRMLPKNSLGTVSYPISIITGSDGHFILTAAEAYGGGGFIQRYNRSGTPLGDRVTFTDYVGWAGMDTAPGPNETFIVVWTSYNLSDGYFDIHAQRFSGDCLKLGGELVVAAAPNHQMLPTVAYYDDGEFIITWKDFRRVNGSDIYFRMYHADGTPNGTEKLVSESDMGNFNVPYVAVNSRKEFAIVWWDHIPPSPGFECILWTFYPDGTPNSGRVIFSPGMTPDIIDGPDDKFLVVWSNAEGHIIAQSFLSNGTSDGNQHTIEGTWGGNGLSHAQIAKRGDRGYYVNWVMDEYPYFIQYGRPLDTEGVPNGEEVRLGPMAGGECIATASEPGGDLMVLLGEWDGINNLVFGRILAPPFFVKGHLVTSSIAPFSRTYGNLIANVTLPVGTGYWVNVTDAGGNVIMPYLMDGEVLSLDASRHPEIRLDLTLWTNDRNVTPIVHELGIGLGILLDWESESDVGDRNISSSNGMFTLGKYLDQENWYMYRDGPVLTPGPAGTWEDDFIWMARVIMDDGLFKMWYAGQSHASYYNGSGPWGTGYATSVDGINWVKYELNPMLYGTIYQVIQDGDILRGWYSNESKKYVCAYSDFGINWMDEAIDIIVNDEPWESYAIYGPCIIKDNGLYKMWYNGYHAGLGYATSPDGKSWTKYHGNPVFNGSSDEWESTGFGTPCILKEGDGYVMYYTGSNSSFYGSIGVAYSDDGIKWIEDEGNPIIKGYWVNPSYWYDAHAQHPTVVRDGDAYYLWYSFGGGICLATNTRVYRSSGTINSTSRTLAALPVDVTPSWNATLPAGTSATVRLRMSPDNVTWSDWETVDPRWTYEPSDFTQWGRYVQYSVSMSTSDPNATPVLRDLRLDCSPLLPSGELLGPPMPVPEGTVVSARAVLDASVRAGTSVGIWLSADNGTTWQPFANGTKASFTVPGAVLRWRLSLLGDMDATPFVRGLSIAYDLRHLPSDITVDVGDDGTAEWTHPGMLEGATPSIDLAAAIDAYLAVHRSEADGEGYVTVPIRVTSATGGTVAIGSVSADWARFPTVMSFGPGGSDLPLDAPITISFSEPMDAASVATSVTIVPAVETTPQWSVDGKDLALDHPPLDEDTVYNVTVLAGATSADGAPLQLGLSWEFRTVLLPRAVSFSPEGDSVPYVSTELMMVFNKPMDRASVEGAIGIAPTAILRDVRWTSDTELMMRAPSLEPDTSYTFTVGTGAKDTLGFELPAQQAFTFRTRATPAVPADAPRITGFGPVGGSVPVRPTLTVSFDRPMDTETVFEAISLDPYVDIAGFLRFNTVYNFTLGAELMPGTTYIVVFNATARSAAGRYMAGDFAWSFTTMAPEERDTVMPTVMYIDPVNGTIDVTRTEAVTIAFSEWMSKETTASAASITPAPEGNWSWLKDKGFFLQFVPEDGFPDARYVVTLKSSMAKDEAGNALDGNENGVFDGAGDDFMFVFVIGRPHLQRVTPARDSIGVRTDAVLSLEFDRAMNSSSVLAALDVDPPLTGNWTVGNAGRTFTLAGGAALMAGTNHTVTLRGTAADIDGVAIGNDESWYFTTVGVAPPPVTTEEEFPWWALGLVLVLAVLGVAAVVLGRRRREPSPPPDDLAQRLPAVVEAPIVEAEAAGAEAPPSAIDDIDQLLEEVAAGPAEAVAAPAAAATAAAAAAAPSPAFRPTSYIVEQVFVVYRDGRLIAECAREECRTTDADLMSGMLIAIQGLIQDGLQSGGELRSINYGDNIIRMVRGRHIVLAAVVYGTPDDALTEELEQAVRRIEGSYAGVIEAWTGELEVLSGVRNLVNPLIHATAHLDRGDVEALSARTDITVLSAMDFFRGYVRLKVAAVNGTGELIADASVEVLYNRDMLRLERVEPEGLEVVGDRVMVGNVRPGERSTVAFLFDPQICQESHVDGALTYYDVRGEVHRVPMKRRKADIVCPVFFTRENANTAMLRRLIKEKLHQSDLRVFRYPKDLAPADVLRMGKAALGGDIQEVSQYVLEGPPYEAEVWYYGETKVKGFQMVMRLSVVEAKGVLEFFVASTAMEPVTGLVAECRRELDRVLMERTAGRRGMTVERDEGVRRELEGRRLLMDRQGEGEIESGEAGRGAVYKVEPLSQGEQGKGRGDACGGEGATAAWSAGESPLDDPYPVGDLG